MFKNRKGISTFIATLLLMVLAVSAGVVIYAYTMGYLGGFGGPQVMGAISLDTAQITSGTSLTAYVRNIGKTSFELDKTYVEGIAAIGVMDPTIIIEGKVGEVTVTGTFAVGTTYTVKLIGKDNTQLSFQAKR